VEKTKIGPLQMAQVVILHDTARPGNAVTVTLDAVRCCSMVMRQAAADECQYRAKINASR
jgi:hypothetical protein